MKYFTFILTISVISIFALSSCSKDDKTTTQQNQQKVQNQNEENDNPADTNLTPEEKFSSSILIDFLGDSDDDDLASFLETEIYKLGANYNGATVIEITPSTWLVQLEKDGNVKNYLLQKYVDFKTNEYYFSFKETTLTITDVISRVNKKSAAGD